MAGAITMQGLIDAGMDSDSLETLVNGDENAQVVTRTGATYPSAKKAINTMFENGGLPAEPFATKALMTASTLANGSYAQVTDDTTNNGLYLKTNGTWVKSAYDPLLQAKADATAKDAIIKDEFKEKLSNGLSDDLLAFSDVDGRVFAKFDSNADMLLSNMDGRTVQDVVKNVPLKTPSALHDLFVFESGEYAIVRVSSDGDFHIPNISKSVQKTLSTVTPVINKTKKTDKRLRFTDEVNHHLLNLQAANNGYAPVPYALMPSNYTITKANIDNLKAITSTAVEIPMDSPYLNDDEFVHPYIIECVGTIRGYKYILMINPFSREAYENPVVYGSNDLGNFTILDGFTQPLDVPIAGGYLSDSGFTYDPEAGELVAYWRSSYYDAGGILITSHWMRRTKDLLNWTAKVKYVAESAITSSLNMFSPSILYNIYDELWYIYYVPYRGAWTYRTATELTGTWSAPAPVLPKGGSSPWHLEVKYVGNKFVALLEYLEMGNLYLGVSADGINWEVCATPVLNENLSNLYKASFLPKFNNDGTFYLEIFFTQNDTSLPVRRLQRIKTNSISL